MNRIAAVVVLLGSVALAAEPDGDLKALQGKWSIEAATLGGRDHRDLFASMKLAVADDQYAIEFAENSDKGAITLDAAKTPKRIDLTTTEKGPYKGRKLSGIYEIKGDTVTICFHADKDERPTKFEAPAKTGFVLLTFKRDKK